MSAFLDSAIAFLEIDGDIPGDRIHRMNRVPKKPATPYLEVADTGFVPQAYTLDGTHGVRDHELIVRAWSTTIDGAQDYMNQAMVALLDARIGADDIEYGPGRLFLRPTVTRDPDDNGVIGLLATLSFVAPKE